MNIFSQTVYQSIFEINNQLKMKKLILILNNAVLYVTEINFVVYTL